MIRSRVRSMLGGMAAGLVLVVLAGALQAQERRASVAAPAADDCRVEVLAQIRGADAARLSRAERSEWQGWCRRLSTMDADPRPVRAATAAPPRSPANGAVTDIGTSQNDPAIWCGANNCFCWKGKKYDGCHHVDNICASPLNCVGTVCGCKPKD